MKGWEFDRPTGRMGTLRRCPARRSVKRFKKMGDALMVSTVEAGMEISLEPHIAVIGVGGAGCNVVNDLYCSLAPVDTVAVNTNKVALLSTSADKKIYICKEVTRGEGTHGDARLGKKCAQVHEEEIKQALVGHDAVFIVAGLGGGTGTGAASVVAEICDRLNVMTFAIVIDPFSFEGSRMTAAAEGLRSLRAVCMNVFRFQNDRMIEQMPELTLERAMAEVNACIRKVIMGTVEKIPNYLKEEVEAVASVICKKEQTGFKEITDIRSSVVQDI